MTHVYLLTSTLGGKGEIEDRDERLTPNGTVFHSLRAAQRAAQAGCDVLCEIKTVLEWEAIPNTWNARVWDACRAARDTTPELYWRITRTPVRME